MKEKLLGRKKLDKQKALRKIKDDNELKNTTK